MEENKTLAELSANISDKLLDSIYLLDILYEIISEKAKEGTILKIINRHIKSSFTEVEKCRKIISVPE